MNLSEIEAEIVSLENAETNWTNIQKLSWLYTVRDHIFQSDSPVIANKVLSVMPEYNGEFGKVVSGVAIDSLMMILSEHFEVVKILYPKEYASVLDRIRESR